MKAIAAKRGRFGYRLIKVVVGLHYHALNEVVDTLVSP